jgi:hypothetical protein
MGGLNQAEQLQTSFAEINYEKEFVSVWKRI